MPCTDVIFPSPVTGTLTGSSKPEARVVWESGEGRQKSLAMIVHFAQCCLDGSEFSEGLEFSYCSKLK